MNPHLEPWNVKAEDFPSDGYASDQLEFLLRYAVLAPSSHNAQPWLFRINAMDVELFADRSRALHAIDPQDRELMMGCGAALFHLRVAAEYFGHQYRVEILPEPGHPDLLARFHLGLSGETRSEDIILFHAITQRRTNRQAFSPDPVPAELLSALNEAAREEGARLHFVQDESTRNWVADLIADADRQQWSDRQFREELAQWVRTKPESAKDGLLLDTVGVKDWMAFMAPSIIRTFDRGGGQAAKDREIAAHSPVLAVLTTDNDSPSAWIQAGQALQAVLLRSRTDDVWASFLNQPIEIDTTRQQLADGLKLDGHPQLLFRLGYASDVLPAPRRSLREVILTHASPRA
jgi:hypothetical protein